MKQNFCENAINTFISINNSNVQGRTELAEKFGVSERTISSYIKYLKEELAVEMRWDKKNKKYVIEEQGIFKEIINNSKLEPMDIWFILIILLRSQYILPTKVKIIEKELFKFVGNKERKEMERLFSFEKNNHMDEYYNEDILKNIYKAFINKNKMKLFYRRGKNEEVRTYVIEPQNITFNHGKIYLIAFNEQKKIRSYRIDRIKSIVLLNELRSEANFSLSDYLSKSWNMFGGDEEIKIIVKFNKKTAKIIKEKLGMKKKVVEDGSDYTIYEFIAYGTDGICIDLLGLEDGFEVLEPLELRDKIYSIGKSIAENHQS